MKRRALISVWDKEGIVDFAKELVKLDWEIISTGGTKKALQEAGLKVIDVENITGFPEAFDGRVKTLHPMIHGGILHVRDNEKHLETLKKLDIKPIDMIVNNLYPFKETVQKEGVSHEEIIENIDIGGPSMIRAAAKNYKYVTVIVDPNDYEEVLGELKAKGETTINTRRRLAGKVFEHTSQYDTLISNYFNNLDNNKFPESLTLTYDNKVELRYGENPHQKAAFYKEVGDLSGTIAGAKQLHGKELSFNNINDANGALEILKSFEEPTVVAVKHANPCGIGSGNTIFEAYKKAYECDKVSIFGGIIAANREIDEETAKLINEIFVEIVIAPSYSDEAVKILSSKKNIRILELSNIMRNDYETYDIKKVLGGILIQERDSIELSDELEVVTNRKPTEEEMSDLLFAWKAVKNVKSNSVLLAKDRGTIGIGMGQVNRIWAVEQAIEHGGDKVEGSVLASDGFFPFSDSIEALGKAGVTAVIQPGGSIRDEDSIKAADEAGIAMIFTHIRHFKH